VRCKRPDTGRRSGRQRVVQFTDDLFSTKAANNMRKEAQIRVAQRHKAAACHSIYLSRIFGRQQLQKVAQLSPNLATGARRTNRR